MACVWKHPQSQYWVARFIDREGRKRNRSTKIVAKDATRKKAEKIADEYEAAANRKRTARQVREVIASLHAEITGEAVVTVTLREHVTAWLARKEPENATATTKSYVSAMTRFLEFMGSRADADIAAVTAADLVKFRNALAKRVASATVNRHVKVLRMMFKAAARDGLLAENPAEHVDTVKKEAGRAERRAFTIDELRAVLAVANDEWRSMVLFGLYTGQRLADIASLTWENIDTVKKEVTLVTRKTGRRMTIPMASPLLTHVQGLDAGDNPSQPLHPEAFEDAKAGRSGTLSNRFVYLLASAGLRKPVSKRKTKGGRDAAREASVLSYHSLRATAATLMHQAGVPAAVVQALVGHDSEAVHRLYIKIGRGAMQEAADKLPLL